MSTLEVNKITPAGSGTTVTLGDSGDSIDITSGATVTNFKSTGIDDNASSTAITLSSIGRMGLGNTSPEGAFHIKVSSDTADIKIESSGGSGKKWTIGSRTDGALQFYDSTGGSEIMRLTSSGLHLGGTGSANALDDYEEGTFSPVVEGSTTTGTATYTTREAHYTKVGNLVSFNIFIRWQSGTGAGNLKITGLPFTSYATTLHHAVTIGWMNDYNYTNGKIPRAYINNNATRINFEESTDNGGSTGLAYDSQAGLILSGSYQTT